MIGSYSTGRPGPIVVVTAGVHGNEPAGTLALRRVFDALERDRVPLKGKLLGLAGNVDALDRKVRFVERDLNRGWHSDLVRDLLARGDAAAEDREQRELASIFVGLFAEARTPVTFLDVHSTSAGGAPFCAISDTMRNRRLAFALPVPVILGLEESIDGTMLSYLDDLGHVACVFEGGQHDDPLTVDHDEDAIWITLVTAGCLAASDVKDLGRRRARLEAASKGIPHVVEIVHREAVRPDDGFVMRPGYVNFQAIRKGEPLAARADGEVRSTWNARILMPLYQEQGDDGFFVVRAIRRFWLHVSTVLRKLRLHVLLPILPGVKWHESRLDTLVVDPRVARWLVLQIFHLFGFRRRTDEGNRLVFSRRRPDFRKLAPVDYGSRPPA
ncbi:MAG: succinylglutamate desuccinylase/aspartoacylase family protein [Planctomycetota bacterium JB042]